MLPDSLKPIGFDTWDKESWDDYRVRLQIPQDEAVLQFFRQVVYDHFEHFNDHYPELVLAAYNISLERFTAQEANDLVRFFGSDVMDWWGEQYDQFALKNQPYIIFQAMSETGTFPFPPVLLEPTLDPGAGRLECGRPLHLIEGTHRVSYLRHMVAKGLIDPMSQHNFVVLRPRDHAV